jgi:hypothetical protein
MRIYVHMYSLRMLASGEDCWCWRPSNRDADGVDQKLFQHLRMR